VTFLLASGAARADGVMAKAAVCSGCHGQAGVPADPSIPILWGQNEGYIYLQLRDLKSGARKSAVMGPMASMLEKPDMLELAAYFSGKSWPNLGQPSAPADLAKQAEAINVSAGCKGCHGSEWLGEGTQPRLAGQGLVYLRESMAKFRDGERTNNPWMVALLKTYPDADIEALARYLAGY
jgi:cytochrome c553